jgi:hypothetical protein
MSSYWNPTGSITERRISPILAHYDALTYHGTHPHHPVSQAVSHRDDPSGRKAYRASVPSAARHELVIKPRVRGDSGSRADADELR